MKKCITKVYLVVNVPETDEEIADYINNSRGRWTKSELSELDNTSSYEGIATMEVAHTIREHKNIPTIVWDRVSGYVCPQDGTEDVGPLLIDARLLSNPTPAKIIDAYDAAVMQRLITRSPRD